MDVAVVGAHASAHLATALIQAADPSRTVVHLLPKRVSADDRLVLVNPEIVQLSPLLSTLPDALDGAPAVGMSLLGPDASQRRDCPEDAPSAWIARSADVTAALARLASSGDHKPRTYHTLEVLQVDERGVRIRVDRTRIDARLVILADPLDPKAHDALGIPMGWERGVMRRYAWATLPAGAGDAPDAPAPGADELTGRSNGGGAAGGSRGHRAMLPMSLDLDGTGAWAWMLRGRDRIELAVEFDPAGASAEQLIGRWAGVLYRHGSLASATNVGTVRSIDLPLAGALDREGVGSRTLLIGPVGGFFSGCAEEVYPSCWSAVHAVECALAALAADHPQDALRDYRTRWGSTLGDYLRGPRNNLRYLLPLAFRNETLARRLADAIFRGQSVVR